MYVYDLVRRWIFEPLLATTAVWCMQSLRKYVSHLVANGYTVPSGTKSDYLESTIENADSRGIKGHAGTGRTGSSSSRKGQPTQSTSASSSDHVNGNRSGGLPLTLASIWSSLIRYFGASATTSLPVQE